MDIIVSSWHLERVCDSFAQSNAFSQGNTSDAYVTLSKAKWALSYRDRIQLEGCFAKVTWPSLDFALSFQGTSSGSRFSLGVHPMKIWSTFANIHLSILLSSGDAAWTNEKLMPPMCAWTSVSHFFKFVKSRTQTLLYNPSLLEWPCFFWLCFVWPEMWFSSIKEAAWAWLILACKRATLRCLTGFSHRHCTSGSFHWSGKVSFPLQGKAVLNCCSLP